MNTRTLQASILLLTAAASAPALAQHADFVLFGRKDDVGIKLDTPEKRTVAPLTSPYENEDATVTSDVRAWFAYHKFRTDIALGGGHATTAAAQVRLALTDRLQLVAYKDGYLWIDTPAINEDGWVDVAAGLKYAIVQDYENQFHWAVGAGYELPVGNPSVLQNDGEFRVWTSINKGFGKWHFGANANYFIAQHHDQDAGNSDHFSWHLHADYYLTDWFSPVFEVNGFHVTNAGTSGLPFQGTDILNLGTGEDDPVITVAPGVEFRPCEHVGIRGAFELPVTDNVDIYGYRWTFSLVWSF